MKQLMTILIILTIVCAIVCPVASAEINMKIKEMKDENKKRIYTVISSILSRFGKIAPPVFFILLFLFLFLS